MQGLIGYFALTVSDFKRAALLFGNSLGCLKPFLLSVSASVKLFSCIPTRSTEEGEEYKWTDLQKETHRCRKQAYGYHRGKAEGEINLESGINRYTLLYIKKRKTRSFCIAQGAILNIL